ncbi:MAG: radical SAM protein [Candidatus Sigynarchaeota archaeon]
MNILLINPPSYFQRKALNTVTMPDIPLNLAYIAAVLEEEGHFVRILDLNVIKTKQELVDRISEKQWDLLGFTGTTSIILNCYYTIRVFKRVVGSAKIVLGGWHASAIPVRTMEECPEIDFIVKGEGEITIKELIKAISSGEDPSKILGIVYRDKQGKIIENKERPLIPNLDDLPFPALHLLPLDAYREIGFNTIGGYFKKDLYISAILTSRGCTGRCIFCADHVINHYTCRFRSPANVVAEIKNAVQKHNIRIFFFMDPHFTFSPMHAKKICELIIKEKLHIKWACQARVDSVSPELLKLMKQAGCTRIGYGIESGSPKVLKIMKKGASIIQMQDAIRWTKEAGIMAVIYLLYGMPGESIEDVKLTRQLLFQLQPDYVNQTIAIPYPGTELREQAIREGLIKDDRWEFYNYPFGNVLEYPGIEKIFRMQANILVDYTLSPRYIWKTIKTIRSIYHVSFYFKVAQVLLLGLLMLKFAKEGDIKRFLAKLSVRARNESRNTS